MKRRSFLKVLGGGLLSIPLAKLMKGKSLLKPAAKTVVKTLPKVSGMPDWFPSLVAKIEKEGRLATEGTGLGDNLKIKELVVPSKSGKGGDEIFTKIEYPDGKIEIQANVEGGAYGQPFELHYTPPKTDMDVTTGKPIKEPGDFSVVEQRPKPDPNDIGNYEMDYEMVSTDQALSDLEKLEKITTGKIKNLKEAEKRATQRTNYDNSPYEDVSTRFPEPDYADGGLASFANGGKAKKKLLESENKNQELSPEELEEKYQKEINDLLTRPASPGLKFNTEEGGQGGINLMFGPKTKQNNYPGFGPRPEANINPRIDIRDPRIGISYTSDPEDRTASRFGLNVGPKGAYVGYTRNFADGGLTKTVPPAKGPNSQGVESLFRRRYS
jgi:hypothetical protein